METKYCASEFIKSDFFRYTGKEMTFFTMLSAFRIPGFFYSFLLRKAFKYKRNHVLGIFYRLIWSRYSYKFGFQIPVTTKIGKGLYIGHFGDIVISHKAVLGNNCNIATGVSIGAIIEGKRKGAPKIGNAVWIGINSVIVGGIEIGDNVVIAPGSFVNFDVPENCLVMGNPGKIVSSNSPIENYIQNRV
jgi:serine O-acetyltransferase